MPKFHVLELQQETENQALSKISSQTSMLIEFKCKNFFMHHSTNTDMSKTPLIWATRSVSTCNHNDGISCYPMEVASHKCFLHFTGITTNRQIGKLSLSSLKFSSSGNWNAIIIFYLKWYLSAHHLVLFWRNLKFLLILQ